MTTYFISDLHLHKSRPEITYAFSTFIDRSIKGQASELYILGDFFDAWIGDDDDEPLNAEISALLKEASDAGTRIYIMHGNRDFLIGNDFTGASGTELLPEGVVIDLYGTPTLLLHGDSLCTQDKEYMAFRHQVRSTNWKQHVLAQPLAARRALAAQLREKSQAMNSLKAEDILDVTQDEVDAVMKAANVTRLIHGHTHRPSRHTLSIDSKTCERIVLGDWHDEAWAIKADANSISLFNWKI